jgi:hypothetical protein
VLDGILGRDHHEWDAQVIRLRVDGDLPFLHALQQRRLRLRAGSVDLVPEDDVGEDRPRLELEVAALLVVHVDPGHVGGQQVRSELDPAKRAVDRPGDRLGEHGLSDPGDVLDQEVALGNQADQGQSDFPFFALDDLLDVVSDAGEA